VSTSTVDIHVQVDKCTTKGDTLFGLGRAGPSMVEIQIQEDMYIVLIGFVCEPGLYRATFRQRCNNVALGVGYLEVGHRRKIRLIESNANQTSEAPSTPRFLFGVVKQFCRFESGKKQSVKLLQNMVCNTTQHPHTLPATHCLYKLYFDFGKGEGGRR
jgi:hypothetical protein